MSELDLLPDPLYEDDPSFNSDEEEEEEVEEEEEEEEVEEGEEEDAEEGEDEGVALADYESEDSPSKRSKSSKSDDMCVICDSRPKTILLLPCRHQNMCHSCLVKLQQKACPMCRVPFVEAINAIRN